MKLIILWLIGGAVSAPSQDYVCSCYGWFSCDSDPENRELYFKTFIEHFPAGEMAKINQLFKNNGVIFKSDILEEVVAEYCEFDKEKKMDIFRKLGADALEYYSTTCAGLFNAQLCASLTKISESTMDLFDSRHLEGKC
ncbi:uncharacterized protein [Parasteatoda tepidariorum]|uniref:uncharacterized protein isoform X2 n=1 Tax=Parasteatoda tepidariorum TaxID=114398 RepID=UPI0039BCAAE0